MKSKRMVEKKGISFRDILSEVGVIEFVRSYGKRVFVNEELAYQYKDARIARAVSDRLACFIGVR